MQGSWEEADKVVGRVNPQHQKLVPETKGRPREHIDKYWTDGRRWPETDQRAA